MSDPITTFAVIGGAANVVSGIVSGVSEQNKNYIAEQEALYNAKQFRYDQRLARWERAMDIDQQLTKGRMDMATGYGTMVARGNYGSSAQSQIFGSTLNLMKDISAIQYKYDNEIVQEENQARVQEYNAKQYRKNRGNAFLGTLINPVSSIAGTYISGWDKGLW